MHEALRALRPEQTRGRTRTWSTTNLVVSFWIFPHIPRLDSAWSRSQTWGHGRDRELQEGPPSSGSGRERRETGRREIGRGGSVYCFGAPGQFYLHPGCSQGIRVLGRRPSSPVRGDVVPGGGTQLPRADGESQALLSFPRCRHSQGECAGGWGD